MSARLLNLAQAALKTGNTKLAAYVFARATGLAKTIAGAALHSWNPALLGTSLLGWWDAERADLITQAGGAVSSWKDVVAGYNAIQATGASKPAYSATGFNSRPGITPDGVDDFLNLESQPFPSICEVWALVNQQALPADTTTRALISFGGTLSASRITIQRGVSTGVNSLQAVVGNNTVGVAVVHPGDFSGKSVVRLVVDGTNARIELNGVASSNVAVVPAIGTTRVRMFAANSTSAANFWNDPTNTVAVTGLLSTTQAAAFTSYLKARGGIP